MKKLLGAVLFIFLMGSTSSFAQSKITSLTFSASESANFDTLYSVVDLNIPADSIEEYQLELSVYENLEGQVVGVDIFIVELEDYGAASLHQIKFDEQSEHYEFIIDILPSGEYTYQIRLKLMDGTLIEESQILSE